MVSISDFPYNSFMSPLQFRIRDLRVERGWSQEQLAAAANTNQSTISGLESGKNKRVDLEVLDRIAKALQVSPEELIVPSKKGKK